MQKWDLKQELVWVKPNVDSSVFLAEGAQINGSVTIKENASVWYNAVLRADINSINVGKGTNIQDGTIIHVENDLSCDIGDFVTVGYRAILHACIVEDGCLIGMGATILNGAVVKRGAVVGAGAVVKENTIVESNTLVVGVPSKYVKQLPESTYDQNVKWAEKYIELARFHKANSAS